jgi:hypothetical protein
MGLGLPDVTVYCHERLAVGCIPHLCTWFRALVNVEDWLVEIVGRSGSGCGLVGEDLRDFDNLFRKDADGRSGIVVRGGRLVAPSCFYVHHKCLRDGQWALASLERVLGGHLLLFLLLFLILGSERSSRVIFVLLGLGMMRLPLSSLFPRDTRRVCVVTYPGTISSTRQGQCINVVELSNYFRIGPWSRWRRSRRSSPWATAMK